MNGNSIKRFYMQNKTNNYQNHGNNCDVAWDDLWMENRQMFFTKTEWYPRF